MKEVSDTIRKRMREIEVEIPRVQSQIDELSAKRSKLKVEYTDLRLALRPLEGRVIVPPAVTNEQVLEAVKKINEADSDEGALGFEVAEQLGVTTRNVSRKLRKLVDDGKLVGDPENGYMLVAVAA
jgi:hypothetical protein